MMKYLVFVVFFSSLNSTLCLAETPDLSCFANEISQLANDKIIREETLLYNEQNLDVLAIEREWRSMNIGAVDVQTVLNNPATEIIHKYIKTHSIDGEGFLIGLNGGLVAATNKTSDFFQADEKQFSEPLKLPFGEAWIKQGIIDESAAAMLIKIAVPVFASDKTNDHIVETHDEPIGVLVIGLSEFVISVAESCETFDSDDD